MPSETLAEFRRRADAVRKIAKGIFDKGERRVVIDFVAEAETMAQKAADSRQKPSPR